MISKEIRKVMDMLGIEYWMQEIILEAMQDDVIDSIDDYMLDRELAESNW
jgi:hypothetical protein